MKKKPIFSILSIISLTIQFSFGQTLITYQKIKSLSKSQIANQYFIPAKYGVDVYKITYTTKKLDLSTDTASGVFITASDTNSYFPIAVYDHGTVGNRHDVPSDNSSELGVAISIASYGYHCVAPDYIGLGISKGIHPYVHPESEAWATIDMIHAVKDVPKSLHVHFNKQLFVTGYSQGGHSAMATAKALQNNKELGIDSLTITAAAPMSGPYSISQEMKNFTLGEKPYSFCAYLGSTMLSAMSAYPEIFAGYKIEDFFKPEYSVLIREYEAETLDLFAMNTKMIQLLSQNGGKVLPKLMFNDGIIDKLFTDQEYSINQALRLMDVCNWKPQFPLKMLYCKADDQVTYRNSIVADSLMKLQNAPDVSAVDVFSTGNHSTCFSPAFLGMIAFFNSYQQIVTSTDDIDNFNSVTISPIPAQDHITVDAGKNWMLNATIKILDITGREILNQKMYDQSSHIDVSHLNNGLYIIELQSNSNDKVIKKLIINR